VTEVGGVKSFHVGHPQNLRFPEELTVTANLMPTVEARAKRQSATADT